MQSRPRRLYMSKNHLRPAPLHVVLIITFSYTWSRDDSIQSEYIPFGKTNPAVRSFRLRLRTPKVLLWNETTV